MAEPGSGRYGPARHGNRNGMGRIGLNERLGLIGLIEEGVRLGTGASPIVADLFSNLWDLVDRTVSGSRVDRLKPEDSEKGFRMLEINSAEGENLGRLNMLYLKKPIPCYYLVYVEVAAPYRKKGLGNRILVHFRDFLVEKSAVGILDNIIPEDDPTFSIYLKHAWEPIESIIGDTVLDEEDRYMVFIPPRLKNRNMREPLLKLVYHLKRKRPAIDMRDNEIMVRRTLAEFKDVYAALCLYFRENLEEGSETSLMRFMFTRFVTKFIAFRRRISELIGYTGGESTEQITLDPRIARFPVKSYAPREIPSKPTLVFGDPTLWEKLPESIKEQPAGSIEALPNYRRPSFVTWLASCGRTYDTDLTLGDLMDLGFDPTRLKEVELEGRPYIFERIQARQLEYLYRLKDLLEGIQSTLAGRKAANAFIKINPPLLVIRDRGNAYVLRRKIEGIHWEEAVEQLQAAPKLKEMNRSSRVDRIIASTAGAARRAMMECVGRDEEKAAGSLACFVPWDLDRNEPRVVVDAAGLYLECVWFA
ncbi:MAG: hypothetical protein JRF59_13045 [Deltaproteobacteria bacterium]|nr:hypothetical protein [Deltaproteobacteria bacterium]MBW1950331.1 hypothetical protein [Deltaproteobacteria bacterium]MBW2348750.1 hypothetical protein [Deltaproteobacteria bacterium]